MKKRIFTITIAVVASLHVVGQTTVYDSLLACYPLNGNATDMVSGLNGTLGSVLPATDQYGTPNACYSFDGTAGSLITLPDDPRLKGQEMTITAWINATTATGSYIVFAKNNNSGGYFEAYALSLTSTPQFNAVKVNSSGVFYATGTGLVSANTWYHVAMTVDQSNVSLYVNGVLNSSTSAPGMLEYEAGKNVQIGASNEPAWAGAFPGKIDNVHFYSRVLSGAEINEIYQTDAGCADNTGINGPGPDEMTVSAYPNPAAGIVCFSGIGKDTRITLYDVLGNRVLVKTADTNTSIDIHQLPEGVYYAVLENGSHKVTRKIVHAK